MAKKKATKKKDPREEFLKRFKIPRNEEEYLLRLLERTEAAITDDETSIDQLFKDQAAKIRQELGVLRKK